MEESSWVGQQDTLHLRPGPPAPCFVRNKSIIRVPWLREVPILLSSPQCLVCSPLLSFTRRKSMHLKGGESGYGSKVAPFFLGILQMELRALKQEFAVTNCPELRSTPKPFWVALENIFLRISRGRMCTAPIPTVPSPTVSRTSEAPGLTAYREEGQPFPRLRTL